MDVRDRSFEAGDVLHADGGRFIDCRFIGCTLAYSGGRHPIFENCRFDDISWRFDGAALRTIQFLQNMNNSPDGAPFVAEIFEPGKYFNG